MMHVGSRFSPRSAEMTNADESRQDPNPMRPKPHETPTQPCHRLQSALVADPRRHRDAGRHRSRADHPASVGDVLAPAQVRRLRRLRDVVLLADDGARRRRRSLGRAADLHHAQIVSHRDSGAQATPRSIRRRSSRASAWVCRNISRPRRCGRAASSSTNSASRRTRWSTGWSACRRTAMPARFRSRRRRA